MKSGGFPVYSILARVATYVAPSQRTLAAISHADDLNKAVEALDLYMIRQLRNIGMIWSECPVDIVFSEYHTACDDANFYTRRLNISCYLVQQGFKAEIMHVAALSLDGMKKVSHAV